MPNEFSIYRKIQAVLDVAKSVNVINVAALSSEIYVRGLSNFLARRFEKKKDKYVDYISSASIARAVKFCLLLNLIDLSGKLTRNGRDALHGEGFDRIVSRQINEYFFNHGVEINKMNITISESLKKMPPVLPTSSHLYEFIDKNKIQYPIFSKMMTLLVQCKMAESSQKKIYLNIAESS